MKKKLFIVAILAMVLLLVFAACAEKEPEPLRICVDLEYVHEDVFDTWEEDITYLLKTRFPEACRFGKVEPVNDIEVECVPASGTLRETTLERIRTELMSGKGPDIFLVACNEKDPGLAEEALFTMPEKAMELAIFLPLDDYMENKTVFAEWDRMNQTVLAAGRNGEGQQIIPLFYRIPAAVYEKSTAEHTHSKEITWMDMLESEDPALAAAAVWTDNHSDYTEGMPFMLQRAPMTEFVLGAIADYEEEELLFTEAELRQRMNEIIELADRYRAGEFDSAPAHYVDFLGQEFDDPRMVVGLESKIEYDVRNGIEHGDTYTMIPLYSDDGGVTAEITAYAAINRNTHRAEEAFRFLDYLASYNAQRCEHIYQNFFYKPYCLGNGRTDAWCSNIPMYDEIMSENHRVYWVNSFQDASMVGWCLSDENFVELCAVREQITHVRFCNVLDMELTQLYRDYYDAIRFDGDPNAVIAEGYRQMQRMLRE